MTLTKTLKSLTRLSLATALAFAAVNVAADPVSGQMVPATIATAEQLVQEGNDIHYKNWQARNLTNKLRIVNHLNAALGVDTINRELFEQLDNLQLDNERFATLTILNVADVSSFLQKMARLQIEDMQRSNSDAEFVLDKEASVRKAWGLPNKGASITLVDARGIVVAHRNGQLSSEEINTFIELVQQRLSNF
jgi:YtfJ family uncharacterized protein